MNDIALYRPAPASSPQIGCHDLRRILIRDFVLLARIGAFRHERQAPQRVRINLTLFVHEDAEPINDDLHRVVCYDRIIREIRDIVQEGHVDLVETLAERIAQVCLMDVRVRNLRARVEKLDVYDDIGSVGVEIERTNIGC